MAEAPHTQMESLIAQFAGRICAGNRQAVCAFGHSLGKPCCFELALQCQRRGLPLPACFIAQAEGAAAA